MTNREPDTTSWESRWGSIEAGLKTSWLRGREKAVTEPLLAEAALRGELPQLPWAGGCPKRLKNPRKIGALNYLAMWQGLRDQELSIDPSSEPVLVCTRTGMTVTFTADSSRLFASINSPEVEA